MLGRKNIDRKKMGVGVLRLLETFRDFVQNRVVSKTQVASQEIYKNPRRRHDLGVVNSNRKR